MSEIKTKLSISKFAEFLTSNKFWLPFWLFFGAILCAYTKFDFMWDFCNYHYYNPWFLLDSSGYDIYTPLAAINSFFNPLLDVPLYLLIKYLNDFPSLIYAIQGLWFGGLIFIFHKITLLFFEGNNYQTVVCWLLCMLIAITGETTYYQAGSSTNEIQLAFLVMFGIYSILKAIKFPELQTNRRFLIVGIIMGIALGLKQTSLTYSFALGFALIISHKLLKRPLPSISLYILGGFIGCVASYGFVMYHNYVDYGNPFLPFLNSIFNSEYFDSADFHDNRYVPQAFEVLYFPYLWYHRHTETDFSDFRGAIFYTICLIFLAYTLKYYLENKKRVPFFENKLNIFCCTWMMISYIIWLKLFAIFRYLIPLEMFFAIFITKALNRFVLKNGSATAVFFRAIFFTIIMATFLHIPFINAGWQRASYIRYDKYIGMEEVKLPENTLVKFYNLPIGYLAPLLAKNNQYFKAVGYVDFSYGRSMDFIERNKYSQIRESVVRNHNGPVVILAAPRNTNNVMERYQKIQALKDETDDFEFLDIEFADRLKKAAKYELRRRSKINQPFEVATETLKDIARYSYEKQGRQSYLPNNDELKNMYCRTLDINVYEKPIICVPEELKTSILPQTKTGKIRDK